MTDPLIDPADLRGVRFPGSFRRYDARAVDDFLESVAQRIEATNDLVERLRREVGNEETGTPGSSTAVTVLRAEPEEASPFDHAAESEPESEPVVEPAPAPAMPAEAPPDLSVMSDDELARLVGEETAHVLGTARSAATEIRSKAEESAARLIRESTTEAKQLTDDARAQADALVAEARTTRDDAVREAEAEVATLKADAEGHAERVKAAAEADVAAAVERAESIRAEADEAAARVRSDADAEAERILEEARTEGRSMLAEAKQVRARVLTDLQRRRDLARDHVDRLLAGRDRLLDAYAAVRTNVDEVTAQFDNAVVEAGEPVADLDETIAAAVADAEDSASDLRTDPAVEEPDATTDDATEDPVVDEDEAAGDGGSADEPVDEPSEEATTDDVVADGAPDDTTDEDAVDPTPGDAADDAGPDDTADEDPPADEDESESESESESDDGDVDALFARIRAERAQSVARAQEVLGEDEPPSAEADALESASDVDDAADEPTAGDDVDAVSAELRADDEQYDARAEVLGAIDKKLTRAMKRRLADEQNKVLDALRQEGSTAFADVVPAEVDHVAAYAKVAGTHLAAAASAGSDGAEVSVDELADALGRTLIEPFRRRIERATSDVDGDADALDDRLRALYREWKVEHIGPAVTDALVAAYSAGQLEAAGPDDRLRWLVEPGSKACPDCHDNALAGGIEPGTPFPTEVTHPPAHPGCRCLLVVDT